MANNFSRSIENKFSTSELNTARERMLHFSKKYSGKTVYFEGLDDYEKFSYAMLDTYLYFDCMKCFSFRFCLTRALENALSSERMGYSNFDVVDFIIIPVF